MPCNGDYLDPSSFEKTCQQMAKYIIYLNNILKKSTPSWVVECSTNCYGAVQHEQGGDIRLAPLLCETIKSMSKKQISRIIYNSKCKTARDLANWWEEHQEADNKRIKIELAAKHDEKLRQQALSKLSREEKRVLGVTSL
jgi:hypothetical protein